MAQWITTREARELTGYNAEYIRQMARRGRIVARQVGYTWMIDKASILKHQKTAKPGRPWPSTKRNDKRA